MTRIKTIFLTAFLLAAASSALAQATDKFVTVNFKGKTTRTFSGETALSVDTYRITGKKGQRVLLEISSIGNLGVFQVLTDDGSKSEEPRELAVDRRRYEYVFQKDNETINAVVGTLRGAGATYKFKVTLKQRGTK